MFRGWRSTVSQFSRLLTAALLTASLLVAGCSASLVSTHVPKNPAAADPNGSGEQPVSKGMFYTLPQTVITVTLPVKMTIKKEGEFADFAPLFFYDRLEEKVESGKELTFKPATFSARGEPDPTQVYYVEPSGKGAVDQSLTFAFTEQGAVTGLKAEVTNNTAGVVLAGVSGLSSLLTKTVLGTATRTSAPALAAKVKIVCPDEADEDLSATPITDANQEEHFKECYLETRTELVDVFDLLTTAQRKSLLDAYQAVPPPKKADDPVNQDDEFRGKLRRRSLYQARAAYDRYKLLVNGIDGALKSPELAAEGIGTVIVKNQEAAKSLVELFLGTKNEVEWNGVFEVVPGRLDGDSQCPNNRRKPCSSWQSAPLLTYVKEKGICNHADLNGAAKPNKKLLAGTTECQAAKELRLKLTLDPSGDQLVSRIADNYTLPSPAGLFYIVPAQMRAEVIEGTGATDDNLGETRLMIAQHGIVSALPSTLGGKSVTHDLKFYDASGAVKSYSLVSKAMIDKGMVDSISSSTNALIEARNKQIEAEREAADEAKQIAAQRQLLEDLVKIQEACGKLENPPEGCKP